MDAPTRYFVRVNQTSGPWHVIEIATSEDWYYLSEDLTLPAADPPFLEVWVQFDKTCMRIYPSDEPLALQLLSSKIPALGLESVGA